jgi:hypothetical protein
VAAVQNDTLVERLVEAVVKARTEINPTLTLMRRFLRDQHDFRAQRPGIADEVSAGFGQQPRWRTSEFTGERRLDRLGIDRERRDRSAIMGRQSTAEIEDLETDAA